MNLHSIIQFYGKYERLKSFFPGYKLYICWIVFRLFNFEFGFHLMDIMEKLLSFCVQFMHPKQKQQPAACCIAADYFIILFYFEKKKTKLCIQNSVAMETHNVECNFICSIHQNIAQPLYVSFLLSVINKILFETISTFPIFPFGKEEKSTQ